MLSYCIKNTENKNPKVVRTKNGRIMVLSKCEVCDSKKSNFIKEQQSTGLLSSLGIKAPLSKISVVGPLLFEEYKMNEIENKYLLEGDKYMPKLHLRQPGFT